jgi:predicted dehydrogenase
MVRIAVIGAGYHSRDNHLPALARYKALHADQVELTALCDLNAAAAEQSARQFGFAHFYTDVDEMLAAERPDACMVITPVAVTASIAARMIERGIPVLIEKPPGASTDQAADLCRTVEHHRGNAMVSVNRRFDPAIVAMRAWVGQRPIRYARGAMLRHNRHEPEFITDTAIHAVDSLRFLCGDVASHSVRVRQYDSVRSYHVNLEFGNGAIGILDVLPLAGCSIETYELAGDGFRALSGTGDFGEGIWSAWQDGRLVQRDEPAAGESSFVRNGTYAETCAFISALERRQPLSPTPADILPSVTLCHEVAKA